MHCRITRAAIIAVLITLAGLQPSQVRAGDDLHQQLGIAEVFTGDLPEMRKRKRIRALVTFSTTDFLFVNGRAGKLHEKSRFVQENKRWHYLDADNGQ